MAGLTAILMSNFLLNMEKEF